LRSPDSWWILGAAATVFFAACAGAPAYVAPSGANTASLTIVNGTLDALPVFAYSDGRNCTGKTQMHPGIARRASATLAITANTPFTFAAAGSTALNSQSAPRGRIAGVAYCTFVGTFVPRPGRSYLAHYRIDMAREGCLMTVREQARDRSGNKSLVPVAGFRLRDGANCN